MNKHATISSTMFRLAVLALAMGSTGSAIAAVANATSTGTVVAPIAITKVADLSFGNFTSSAAAGTVTISPNNARGVSGGVTAAGGTSAAARFDVVGSGTSTYSISLTGTSVLTSGADTMAFTRVSDVSASAITSGDVTTGTLTAGAQSIFVGGVLTVAANQPAGVYGGTVIATVDYN